LRVFFLLECEKTLSGKKRLKKGVTRYYSFLSNNNNNNNKHGRRDDVDRVKTRGQTETKMDANRFRPGRAKKARRDQRDAESARTVETLGEEKDGENEELK
jgi:hypothetical protein